MTRRRAWLAVALCALAAGAPASARAQDELPPAEALSANVQTFVNDGWSVDPYLTTMRASGWTGARGDAFWYRVEATQGTYDWSYLDGLKAKFDAGGVRWQPILEGSPGWARDATGDSLALPTSDHVADFARFAAAFAARYGPGGPRAGALPVTDVELYNEENAAGAGAYTDAPSYARLYAAARTAIKAVQPAVRVIVGAILYDSDPPTDADYIKSIFATLAGTGADGIGMHPYAPTAIGVVNNLRRMQQGLVDAGQAGLPIYVNELGYPAALDGAVPKAHAADGPTTDEARAGTVSLETDALLASDCGIRNIGYFDLVSQENNRADTDYLSSETWKGLERRADGSLTITGAAYRDAGARWRADPVPGTVHLCGPTAGPGTAPLPLGLDVARPSPMCLRPTVTYRGFPIEEATVVISKPDGRSSSLLTDAYGHLARDFCVDDPVAYTVQAEVSYRYADVPRFALSPALSCQAGGTTPAPCTPAGAPGSSAGGPTATAPLTPAGQCLLGGFRVTGSRRLRVVLRRGLRMRASGCATGSGAVDRLRRRVRLTATVTPRTAVRVGLARRLPARAVVVGSGRRVLAGTRAATVVVRFRALARRRLASARTVRLVVRVQVAEGGARGTATRAVVLRR